MRKDMNYNHIANQRDRLKERLAILDEGIDELLAYLKSPKFYDDESVNSKDILLRLREVKNAADSIEI